MISILNKEIRRFISEHRTDDVSILALQVRKTPAVNMPAVLTQIAGWQ